jgi:gliding motility-associated-like protein
MKEVFFLAISIFFSFDLLAQNLVPNHNFDVVDSCNFVIPHTPNAWTSAAKSGTPDTYHNCATINTLRPPDILACDNLMPHSGNGFIGLLIYGFYPKEYLQAKLERPLQRGHKYYLEFYVAAKNSCNANYAYTDGIGLGFSPVEIDTTIPHGDDSPLSIPVGLNNQSGVINNVGTWRKVSGCYTAIGNEKYVLIGSYKTNAQTQVDATSPADVLQNYLFIDDISVIEFDILPDTILLCDDEITLSGDFYASSFQWNTGEYGSEITVNSEGQYVARVNYEGCRMSDTTYVFDVQTVTEFERTMTICDGKLTILNPNMPGNHIWSDGSNFDEISVTKAGNYQVVVVNECGTYTFNYTIHTKDCDCKAAIPNAFSPNADGANDVFEFFINCGQNVIINTFSVFDRWGNQVFQTNSEKETWDGTYKGQPMDSGGYAWFLEYKVETPDGMRLERFSGEVFLMR